MRYRSGTFRAGVVTDQVVVFWLADTSRFHSMVTYHLMKEALLTVNRGRIDDPIPISVGVANARRWPIFSREVAARGIISARTPKFISVERYDYLLTVISNDEVDAANAPRRNLPVIALPDLAFSLESASSHQTSRNEFLRLLEKLARPPVARPRRNDNTVECNFHEIADLCLGVVNALGR